MYDRLGLVADSVIGAIAMLEFEIGLRTRVQPRGCWCHCGDFSKPSWVGSWSWGRCGCYVDPYKTKLQFRTSVVFELQLVWS